MSIFELKSLEDASIIRKFSVLFTLTSVFPLTILATFYFILYVQGQTRIDPHLFYGSVFVTALFAFIGFIYMRQSLTNINKVSLKFQNALKENIPKGIDFETEGNNEVALLAHSFNKLAQRFESSILELEKSKHLLLQALDREQRLAMTDHLTGIANRRVFYELVDMEINKFRRYGRPFTVLLLDIDNLKDTNDSYGHQAGDALLCAVANTIKENIRITDIAARIGGDEFAVLLTESGAESFQTMVTRLQNKLLDVVKKNGQPVTFSIGVATYNIAPENVDKIMKKVDDLMYAVKRTGKNSLKHEVINN